jgi:hypothetical protein
MNALHPVLILMLRMNMYKKIWGNHSINMFQIDYCLDQSDCVLSCKLVFFHSLLESRDWNQPYKISKNQFFQFVHF